MRLGNTAEPYSIPLFPIMHKSGTPSRAGPQTLPAQRKCCSLIFLNGFSAMRVSFRHPHFNSRVFTKHPAVEVGLFNSGYSPGCFFGRDSEGNCTETENRLVNRCGREINAIARTFNSGYGTTDGLRQVLRCLTELYQAAYEIRKEGLTHAP